MAHKKESCAFARPANPDDVLDSMTDEQYEKDKFLPYWAQQWPACSPLFNFLSTHAGSVIHSSASVCEIGCGLGIISTLLQMKKMRIVATDLAFDACRYASYNMRQYSSVSKVVCSDWRLSPFKMGFDCVVGSDIFYEQRWISPVLDFLKSSMKIDGAAYIADPCRQWWQEFQDAAVTQGFTLNKVWQEAVNQGKTTVEVLRLELKKV
jgi:predicted nicotinamide N-methyase